MKSPSKMNALQTHVSRQTIDEIGWTPMHLKLFILNGFGYAADSLVLSLQVITSHQAALEFRPSFAYGLNVAVYTGMLVGVLFWGLGRPINIPPLAYRRYSTTLSLQVRTSLAVASLSTFLSSPLPSSPFLLALPLVGFRWLLWSLLPRKYFPRLPRRQPQLFLLHQ